MINSKGAPCAASDNLGLECRYAGVKLGHGQRIEILSAERRQHIVRPPRKKFFRVHEVDR